jgi:hypothetical protein
VYCLQGRDEEILEPSFSGQAVGMTVLEARGLVVGECEDLVVVVVVMVAVGSMSENEVVVVMVWLYVLVRVPFQVPV